MGKDKKILRIYLIIGSVSTLFLLVDTLDGLRIFHPVYMFLHLSCELRAFFFDNFNCYIYVFHEKEIDFCMCLDAGNLTVREEKGRFEWNYTRSSDVDCVCCIFSQLSEGKDSYARFNGYDVGEMLRWNNIII
jgi:hypothetical protein